jgi:FMN phosphatase YigB (HAD superfamily)
VTVSIEAVIFDLGNVLIDVIHERAITALAAHCPQGTPSLHEIISNSTLLDRLESGRLEATQFYTEVSTKAQLEVGLETFCAAFCDIFAPVTEMIDAHAQMRRAGLSTYLFSNTSALHFEHLASRYPFLAYFDAHFLSYQIGWMKPDARAYEAVEQGVRPKGARLLYIDDKLENIQAGEQRGWQVIHHVDAAATIAQLRALRLI